ncbi:ABC transporter, sulfate transport, ATP-binding protein isoform 2 [Galdieria sulphuraria]|uniref:Probable ATP-dependent transporter ycf16 n=1 Tax=Galdieria sulphuraria TaxID=130081 RepID=M2WQL8_GALSU|nr:ABC transporter, sulfate transport, ATP-binding protein isoform 2 [Galdieria sulphuraria]EME26085.1 ABC transporter, sulfate transport, ATP-binding protein isoform 2 [Galdieria sulphuraria]|eukprot:XP_005702605.1 ABC transporter, sulfate transport, ATP-binding protein isoform 2 [Galdieria sulphuraria]
MSSSFTPMDKLCWRTGNKYCCRVATQWNKNSRDTRMRQSTKNRKIYWQFCTLQFKNVGLQVGKVPIIRDINFSLFEGEILCLLGPSGSGKSTILRIAAGLTRPTEGFVYYQGKELHGINEGAAIVFQNFALFPWLTVSENVELGIRGAKSKIQRKAKAEKAIDMIGLDGYENAYPKELSGGMRQRVGFARAIAVEPELLCMDEPFSALDVLTGENLKSELLRLWQAGEIPTKSILIVTHSIEEAVGLADRIIILGKDPGHIRSLLRIPLSHPRDRKSRSFQNLIDHVYTLLSRPDATCLSESIPVVVSKKQKSTFLVSSSARLVSQESSKYPTLPSVRIGSVAGLLSFFGDERCIDLYRLGQRLQLDVDDLYPLLEAGVILNILKVTEGDVMLTDQGSRFSVASIDDKKSMVREALLQSEGARLIQQIYWLLRQTKRVHRVPEELILDTILEKYFSPSESRRQLEVAIEWGRYAELFGYDAPSGELFLDEEDPQQEE